MNLLYMKKIYIDKLHMTHAIKTHVNKTHIDRVHMNKIIPNTINEMGKIGIIGIGMVGNAIYQSFLKKGLNVLVYDKYKNIGKFDNILHTDIVFLCLPTLYNEDLKSYNKEAIDSVCWTLNEYNYTGLVVIKSTVEPETIQSLSLKYNLKLIHNPEFLTARTAFDDFENQSHIVIGKSAELDADDLSPLIKLYKTNYPKAEISICSSTESELMKIAINNFYAVKIQFFNELFFLSDKLSDVNYQNIRNLMLKNNWIHPQHTTVPGPDGKHSYGGMCFPKDTNAFLQFMINKKSPHKIIKAAIEERNELRDGE